MSVCSTLKPISGFHIKIVNQLLFFSLVVLQDAVQMRIFTIFLRVLVWNLHNLLNKTAANFI